MWLSLVERCVRDAEVAGSNPVASTNSLRIPWLRGSFFACGKLKNVSLCYLNEKRKEKAFGECPEHGPPGAFLYLQMKIFLNALNSSAIIQI